MKLLYENTTIAVFLFPYKTEEFLVVINKEAFSNKAGAYNRSIGCLFWNNIQASVDNGSYIQEELEKWFTSKEEG